MPQTMEEYKAYVHERLQPISDLLPSIAMGDFSKRLDVPAVEDEFTELYVSLNYMLEDIQDNFEQREVAEKALRASEEKYRALLTNINDLVMEIDSEGKFSYVSPQIFDMFGYTQEESIGLTAMDFVHPNDIEKCMKAMETLDEVKYIEYRSRHKDGHYVHVSTSGRYVLDGAGGFKIISVLRDITERKKAEKALLESEDKYRKLFENAGEGILHLDTRGFIVDVNPKVLEILGCKHQEICGKDVMDLLSTFNVDTQSVKSAFQKTLSRSPAKLEEWKITNKLGQELVLSARPTVIRKGNEVVGVSVMLDDITERKRAEEALVQSSQQWSSTFNAIQNSVCLIGVDGKVLQCNETTESLLDKTHDEIVGKHCWEEVHGTSAPIEGCPFVRLRESHKRETMELNLGDRIFNALVDPVLDDEGKLIGAVHIMSDITERKAVEKREKVYIQDLQYLSDTAMGFVKLPSDADIYPYIAEHLKNLVDDSIVIVNSFDPKTDFVTVRALTGFGKLAKSVFKILGQDPLGTHYKINEKARRQLITGKYHKVPGKLNELMFGEMSNPICHALEKLFGIKEIHSMGFILDGKLLGIVVIILRKETKLKNKKAIETFINQAAVALQRKQAEEALRESEDRYRGMFENVNDMVIYVTKWGKIIDVNQKVEDIFGFKREEVIGKNFMKLGALYLKDLPRTIKLFRHAAKVDKIQDTTGKCINLMEMEIKRKNGQKGFIEINSTTIKKDGKLEGFLSIIRDITERKKAEEAVKDSEEKIRRILESSPDAITVTDLNGTVIECNQATLKLHGFSSKEEAIGMNAFDLISQQDHDTAQQNLKKTIELGEVRNVEYSLLAKDGREFPGELSVSVLKDLSGNPVSFIAITKDITTRKRIEQELLQSKKLASVGQLAAGVAHELNNPLTNISLLAGNMSKMTNNPGILKKISNLTEQGMIAIDIVQSLLDFSRKIEPSFKVVALNKAISESISQARIRKPETIEIIEDFLADIPKIKADPNQLCQVFTNIIDNAFDAMPKGGKLTITTKRTDEGDVKVRFTDTGMGLSKEDMGSIFDPFFTKKEVGKGVGLGLSICHGIVSAHNGTIEVESEKGKGTTFTIKLPVG